MPYTLIVHIKNSDPVIGEAEELPSPSDTLIVVNNPRRLDGKDLQVAWQSPPYRAVRTISLPFSCAQHVRTSRRLAHSFREASSKPSFLFYSAQ